MDDRAGLCYLRPMPRIRLTIAYDGTDFAGWQLQGRGERTVQGEVERAIAKIVAEHNGGQRIPLIAAGRTDSGVHALGQVAHFDAPDALANIPWPIALNGRMRPDVRIVEASLAHPRFHSQYDALSKIYAYTIWTDRSHVNPLRRRFVWGMQQRLNLDAMDEAAALFLGTNDYNSFKNAGTPVGPRGTVRTVSRFWREPGQTAPEITWRIQADGFLKQMVRNIMGCLVFVGVGKVTPQDVRSIIEQRDRNHLLPTAPPWGLCMERVFYPEATDCGDQMAATDHDGHQLAGGAEHQPDQHQPDQCRPGGDNAPE
jgi:pseudouridylate synthase I